MEIIFASREGRTLKPLPLEALLCFGSELEHLGFVWHCVIVNRPITANSRVPGACGAAAVRVLTREADKRVWGGLNC